MNQSQSRKWMTEGEAGLAAFFAVFCLSLPDRRGQGAGHGIRLPRLARRGRQPRGGLCDLQPLFRSAGGVAASGNQRPAQLQSRSDQVRGGNVGVLGNSGLHRRIADRIATGLAGAEFRSAMDQLRPPAAAAHLGRDLRLRRQRADRDLVLCGAENLPGPSRRRSRAVVRRPRL